MRESAERQTQRLVLLTAVAAIRGRDRLVAIRALSSRRGGHREALTRRWLHARRNTARISSYDWPPGQGDARLVERPRVGTAFGLTTALQNNLSNWHVRPQARIAADRLSGRGQPRRGLGRDPSSVRIASHPATLARAMLCARSACRFAFPSPSVGGLPLSLFRFAIQAARRSFAEGLRRSR